MDNTLQTVIFSICGTLLCIASPFILLVLWVVWPENVWPKSSSRKPSNDNLSSAPKSAPLRTDSFQAKATLLGYDHEFAFDGQRIFYTRGAPVVLPNPVLNEKSFTAIEAIRLSAEIDNTTGTFPEQLKIYTVLASDLIAKDDLADICFRLNLSLDDFSNGTRIEIARELLRYSAKRGKLEELKQAILASRQDLKRYLLGEVNKA